MDGDLIPVLLTIKNRDAQFQRLMHAMVAQRRLTPMTREEAELEYQKHWYACYGDVEKSLHPRPQD